MQRCHLSFLGGLTIKSGEGVEMALSTKKDRQLVAYLAMQDGCPQSRSKLAALFWADRAEPQARDSLRQSLTAIRKAFRAEGLDPIEADRSSVTFDTAGLSIDAVTFAEGCAASAPTASIAELYRGPFLDGEDISTPEFEHWVAEERSRLEGLAQRLVTVASISVLSASDLEAALQLGGRLLSLDRTLELVYRAMMRVHHGQGNRAAALKIYASCCDALRQELDIGPDRDTETLYREILTDRPPAAAEPPIGRAAETASIAVMPLANLTGNEKFNFLCEGLAEDISTGLGRFRSLFVIDRYSAATVAAATSDTVEIGQRLGASLLVQGSIQVREQRFRVTVRLVDSSSRAQSWSDVFESELSKTPEVPDRIAAAIIATIQNRAENTIINRSMSKPSMAAYECALRGIKHLRGHGPDDNDRAIALFHEALRLDPDYALAQGYLAFAEIVINDYDMAPRELLVDCKSRIDNAVSLDPEDGRLRWLLGHVHGYLREFAEEKNQLEKALALNPNDANSMMSYGSVLAFHGKFEDAFALMHNAMRLNPYHPEWYWIALGNAFMAAERFADAIEAYRHRTRPKVWVLTRLAICYAHLDRMEEAREMARQVLELDPEFRISKLWKGNWVDYQQLHDGMVKAGLPE